MKTIRYLVLFFLITIPATVQATRNQLPADTADFISDLQLELTNWMMFYYKKPAPDDFPVWLQKASMEELLREEKRQFPFLGFGATVFAKNAGKIPQWMNTIDTLPEKDRKTVLIALWLSDTKASEEALSVESRQNLLHGQNFFNFSTDEKPPNLDLLNQAYGGFLDIQWGRFLASGDKEHLRLIIKTLEYGKYFGAIEKYRNVENLSDSQNEEILMNAILDAAVWSLISNCKQHELIKRYCIEIYENDQLGKYEKGWLGMLLTEVAPEKYELINRGEGKGLMVCPVEQKQP